MAIAGLQVAHTHLAATLVAAGVKQNRIPKLTEFLPDVAGDTEPEKPRDFNGWAAALLPLAR